MRSPCLTYSHELKLRLTIRELDERRQLQEDLGILVRWLEAWTLKNVHMHMGRKRHITYAATISEALSYDKPTLNAIWARWLFICWEIASTPTESLLPHRAGRVPSDFLATGCRTAPSSWCTPPTYTRDWSWELPPSMYGWGVHKARKGAANRQSARCGATGF